MTGMSLSPYVLRGMNGLVVSRISAIIQSDSGVGRAPDDSGITAAKRKA